MKLMLCLTVTLCVSAFICRGQEIAADPEGDYIFSVPTVNVQTEIAMNSLGLEVPFWMPLRYRFFYDENGKEVTSMYKALAIFGKLDLVNNDEGILSFSEKPDWSPKFELGAALGFDSLKRASEIGESYWTAEASVFAAYQHYRFYDTISDSYTAERSRMFSPGVKGSVNFYFRTAFAISLSGSWQYGIDKDELTPFQKRSKTFYVDNNVSSVGDKAGYLMKPDPQDMLRFSLSVPIFSVSGSKNDFLPFVVIPYLVANGVEDKWTSNGGVIISFLESRFFDFDRTAPKKGYEFKAAFSIGYNIFSTGSGEDQYLFISGTFPLGELAGKNATTKNGTKK